MQELDPDDPTNIFAFLFTRAQERLSVTQDPILGSEPGLKFGVLDLKIKPPFSLGFDFHL